MSALDAIGKGLHSIDTRANSSASRAGIGLNWCGCGCLVNNLKGVTKKYTLAPERHTRLITATKLISVVCFNFNNDYRCNMIPMAWSTVWMQFIWTRSCFVSFCSVNRLGLVWFCVNTITVRVWEFEMENIFSFFPENSTVFICYLLNTQQNILQIEIFQLFSIDSNCV